MHFPLYFLHGTCVIKVEIQHDINELFQNLQNTLVNNEQVTTALTVENDIISSSEFIRNYPLLKRLIDFFITLSKNIHPTNEPFLHYFLESLLLNLPLAKSRYRYSEFVIDFALCLSILAGRNAYEFLRLTLGDQDAYLAMHQNKARVRPIRMKFAGVTTSTDTFNC